MSDLDTVREALKPFADPFKVEPARRALARIEDVLTAALPALEKLDRIEQERYDYEQELAEHDGTGNPGLVERLAVPALLAIALLDSQEERTP